MLSFGTVLFAGLLVRLAVIVYGEWHDKNFVVPFTDVDYRVFTDAAKYIADGSSPYLRHTYRYPPILAWMLVPNLFIHQSFGKILFSLLDLLVSFLIKLLVQGQGFPEPTAQRCAMFWLFNPVSIVISTRGNSDSLIAAIVLLALVSVIRNRPAFAGLVLGLAIHVRLYPIIYALPMYLSLRKPTSTGGIKALLLPNTKQITLVFTCILFLATATAYCFHLYGFQYLHESIIYHFIRKDTRHNFSLFFYLLYLNPQQPSGLLFLPQFILLLIIAVAFYRKENLPFCLFAQSFVFVTYNPVVTSQYWIWVLSLLAPSIPRLNLSAKKVVFLSGVWLLAQLAWLVPAYLLEFKGRNTFFFIWVQSVGVFCANLAVLVRLLRNYDYYEPRIHVKEE